MYIFHDISLVFKMIIADLHEITHSRLRSIVEYYGKRDLTQTRNLSACFANDSASALESSLTSYSTKFFTEMSNFTASSCFGLILLNPKWKVKKHHWQKFLYGLHLALQHSTFLSLGFPASFPKIHLPFLEISYNLPWTIFLF